MTVDWDIMNKLKEKEMTLIKERMKGQNLTEKEKGR